MSYRIILMVLIGTATLSTSSLYASKKSRQHHPVAHAENRETGLINLTKRPIKERSDSQNPLRADSGNTLLPFSSNLFKALEEKRVQEEKQKFKEELARTVNMFDKLEKTLAQKQLKAQEDTEKEMILKAKASLVDAEKNMRQAEKTQAQRTLIALNDRGHLLPTKAHQEFKEEFGASTTSSIVQKLGISGLEDPETLNKLNTLADRWAFILFPEKVQWVKVVPADTPKGPNP